MQRCAGEIARMNRLGHRQEIAGRPDQHAGDRPTDLHGDHVGLQAFAEPYAGVVPTCHDVGEPVLDDQFQRDVGKGFDEVAHPWRKDQLRRGPRHGDAQIAGRPVACFEGGLQRQLDLAERRPQPLEQGRAGFRRRNAARRARQQWHAEFGLEARYGMAHGRRRDRQLLGCATKAAMRGDHREHSQLREMTTIH